MPHPSMSSASNSLHSDMNGNNTTTATTTSLNTNPTATTPNTTTNMINNNNSTTTTPNNKHHSNVTADEAQRCFPHHLHHVHHRSRSSSSAAASSRNRSASNASVTTTNSSLPPLPQSSSMCSSSTSPAASATSSSVASSSSESNIPSCASSSSSSAHLPSSSVPTLPSSSSSSTTTPQQRVVPIISPQPSQCHPATAAMTPQSLNLMNPTTPQQRITIEKLLLIPPESVQSRNSKLYDLLIQLRRQYLWQAVTTPIVTTNVNDKDGAMHPLERMKQEDAMVFASHIDEICNCVNKLLDELNEEEYELGLNNHNQGTGYRVRWLQEEELKARAKINAVSAPNEDSECVVDPMHEDEEFDEEIEEDEGVEGDEETLNCAHNNNNTPVTSTSSSSEETPARTAHHQLSTSSAPVVQQHHHNVEQTDVINTPSEQQQDEYDEEAEDSEMTDNEETESSAALSSNNINAQSQDGSNTKLQEFFRQLETVEPIPNGKLSFFQNHHLVVGKFDRQALVQNNTLSCTVMKKSTLNVVVHRRCTRLRNDTDVNSRFTPFDATSGNYHDRRILKKQALAKSVVRFAKVKVDFGSIVEQVLQSQNQYSLPFSANLLSALGTFSTSNSTQAQQRQ